MSGMMRVKGNVVLRMSINAPIYVGDIEDINQIVGDYVSSLLMAAGLSEDVEIMPGGKVDVNMLGKPYEDREGLAYEGEHLGSFEIGNFSPSDVRFLWRAGVESVRHPLKGK